MPRISTPNGTPQASTAVIEPAKIQPPTKPGNGVKKVTFGSLKPKKESTKSEYPILPDPDGEIYALAKTIKQQAGDLEALEGALEANKAELRAKTRLPYFEMHKGKTNVPSSISIPTTSGDVLVSFQNRYKKLDDDAPIIALFGADFVDKHFKQAFTITISGEALPSVDPANPDRNPAQEFVDALTDLINRHNAHDAVAYKAEIKPVKEFHALRHQILTPDQNIQLDEQCTMIIAVKTSGRDSQ